MACEKSADASLAPPRHAWQQMSAAQPLVFPCAHYIIAHTQLQKNKPFCYDFFKFSPFNTASVSSSPLYTSFKEKNGAFSCKSFKNILSPSHRFSFNRSSFLIHSRTPSLQEIISPVYPSAVYRHMYSVPHTSETKVTIPRNFQEVSVRPVSSFASLKRQSSGLSPSSKWPPIPIHLSLFSSFFLLTL